MRFGRVFSAFLIGAAGFLADKDIKNGFLFTGAIGRHARQRLGSFRDDLGAFAPEHAA